MANSETRRTVAQRLTDIIAPFAPSYALSREVAMTQRDVLRSRAGNFEGAGRGPRGKDFRINRADAVEASRADQQRLSWIGRDMMRNNPRVVKIRRQLVSNVVGTGILPSVRWLDGEGGRQVLENKDPRLVRVEKLMRDHCLTTDFDADGKLSMLGMMSLGFGSIVIDGEVLFRRRFRRSGDGYPLNFQVQVLEGDYLNRDIDGELSNGNYAVQGIEFNRVGKRVAYHLYADHPGGRRGYVLQTRRVDARNIIHAFDVTRPGQQRGISWIAPVITLLHDLHRYQDGQVKRQEIASLFAGILKTTDSADELEADLPSLTAGTIFQLGEGEELDFNDPPSVDGYESFMNVTDRTIAAAMGITYEALTGDYSKVNYTSGRMARMDVDPNVRDWQQNLLIGKICHGFASWFREGVEDVADIDPDLYEIGWTPPVRPVIDPTKDYKADEVAMRSGQKSRRQTIRERGGDPDKVDTEIQAERSWANQNGLIFSSDAGAQTSQVKETENNDQS